LLRYFRKIVELKRLLIDDRLKLIPLEQAGELLKFVAVIDIDYAEKGWELKTNC